MSMTLVVHEEGIGSIVTWRVCQSTDGSDITGGLCFGRNTLQTGCDQSIAFSKSLHVSLTQWSDKYGKPRFPYGKNTVFGLSSSDQEAYGSMFVLIPRNDLLYKSSDVLTR